MTSSALPRHWPRSAGHGPSGQRRPLPHPAAP